MYCGRKPEKGPSPSWVRCNQNWAHSLKKNLGISHTEVTRWGRVGGVYRGIEPSSEFLGDPILLKEYAIPSSYGDLLQEGRALSAGIKEGIINKEPFELSFIGGIGFAVHRGMIWWRGTQSVKALPAWSEPTQRRIELCCSLSYASRTHSVLLKLYDIEGQYPRGRQ